MAFKRSEQAQQIRRILRDTDTKAGMDLWEVKIPGVGLMTCSPTFDHGLMLMLDYGPKGGCNIFFEDKHYDMDEFEKFLRKEVTA